MQYLILSISRLEVNYMILLYLGVEYMIPGMLINLRIILGCDNVDIRINVARVEPTFGNVSG